MKLARPSGYVARFDHPWTRTTLAHCPTHCSLTTYY